MKYTIFSIDNHTDLRTMARFLRYLDELRAMNKLSGNVVQCIGSWEGKLEPSFLCRSDDWFKFIAHSTYVEGQECVMQVSECNKQYAQLVYNHGGDWMDTWFLGSLKDVDKEGAMMHKGWTYRPDLNTYWVVVTGNPDTVRGED